MQFKAPCRVREINNCPLALSEVVFNGFLGSNEEILLAMETAWEQGLKLGSLSQFGIVLLQNYYTYRGLDCAFVIGLRILCRE